MNINLYKVASDYHHDDEAHYHITLRGANKDFIKRLHNSESNTYELMVVKLVINITTGAVEDYKVMSPPIKVSKYRGHVRLINDQVLRRDR